MQIRFAHRLMIMMLPLLHAPCHRGYWRSWPSFYSRMFPFLVIFARSNRAGGARECRPSVYVLAAPTDPAVERPGCALPRGYSRTVSPPCRVRADYYRRYRSAVLAAKETAADQFRLVHPGAIRRGCLLRSTCTAMRCGEDRYFVWSSHVDSLWCRCALTVCGIRVGRGSGG